MCVASRASVQGPIIAAAALFWARAALRRPGTVAAGRPLWPDGFAGLHMDYSNYPDGIRVLDIKLCASLLVQLISNCELVI